MLGGVIGFVLEPFKLVVVSQTLHRVMVGVGHFLTKSSLLIDVGDGLANRRSILILISNFTKDIIQNLVVLFLLRFRCQSIVLIEDGDRTDLKVVIVNLRLLDSSLFSYGMAHILQTVYQLKRVLVLSILSELVEVRESVRSSELGLSIHGVAQTNHAV